jgi:photosystem II stability/assembly factor-like uncharacterized protein
MSRRLVAAAALLTLTALPAAAQSPLDQALKGLTFREIGPAITGGRVDDIEGVESEPSTFFVGMATGGLWRTTNEGQTWTPLFDHEPCTTIGDVAVFQANPNILWVGTGEPQNRQSSTYGCGVFRSTDGGRTWADLGLKETRQVGRIRLDPNNPDVAYVAAVGHLFGPNEERGVFRTRDGGKTWQKVLYVDENTGAIDLAMDPSDPNTLFAATYQRRRRAFGFSASGGGGGIWRTTDGGDHWTELKNGLPKGEKGRIGLAIYRRDGNLVYASVEALGDDNGLYRSTDRGETWEKVSDRNPRPMYFSQVRIDPNNPDRIYEGGVQFGVSDDGGKTWWADGAPGAHVDDHAIWIDPHDSNHVLIGNDGGVAQSWDGAEHWRLLNNFAVGQFYEIGLDMSDPYRVCGGLQDNSSWCAPNESTTSYGIMNRDWTDVWGGDGFFNKFDPGDSNILYSESQGGNAGWVNMTTGETKDFRPVARPTSEKPDRSYRFNWNAPIEPSVHHPGWLYVGGDHLMRSKDRGATWEEVSPDLTRHIDRDTLTIMGQHVTRQTLSGNDGVSSYGTITVIAESPMSDQVVWVGTDDGNLQVTRDGGATWNNVVGNVKGLPARSYVSGIEPSHAVAGRVYATFDRHYDDDYRPWVFVSEDYGASWKPITSGLPEWSVNVIREHPHEPDLLFLGDEIGVWVSMDRGQSWHRMANLPTVKVDDIAIHPRDNDLVLATHGRSIWIMDDLNPLEAMTESPVLESAATLFKPAEATEWFRSGGWPFWGDAYHGQNPPDGAMLRYWVKANRKGRARLVVRDGAGDTVRVLDGPADAGLHQVVWDMREKAPVRVTSAGEGRGGGGDGSGGFRGGQIRGPLVLPGAYQVSLSVGGAEVSSAEQSVGVRLDPRANADPAALQARHDAVKSAAAISGTIRDAQAAIRRLTVQLADTKKLLAAPQADEPVRRSRPDTSLAAAADSLTAELDSLGARIGRVSPGRAVSGLESSASTPSADETWVIDRAWNEVPPLVDQLNRIITEGMPAFNRRLDQAGVRPSPGRPVTVPKRPGGR